MKVYVVMIADTAARVYSNRKAAIQHVKLVRETKQEMLDACGINPEQVFYVTHTVECGINPEQVFYVTEKVTQ